MSKSKSKPKFELKFKYEDDPEEEAIQEKKEKKKKKKKKKRKYYSEYEDDIVYEYIPPAITEQHIDQSIAPNKMCLGVHQDPGFFFGVTRSGACKGYIGMPLGTEGHIAVIGGSGSGKSAGIVKPTLQTWQGAMCVTDIKGELSDFYIRLGNRGLVTRPYIIFDPLNEEGIGYDPFAWLRQDDESNLLLNIWDIVDAILPVLPEDSQPYWVESERAVFAAALLYYFRKGYGFSESVLKLLSKTTTALCAELLESDDPRIKVILGEIAELKSESLASIDRGLRNKLMLFAVDPYISNAFRGSCEDAKCFTWDDLNVFNIFLCVPEDRLNQWSGAINLMYTQLIRHLTRRPDMHSKQGEKNVQTLLLMDEFARFGKLEIITDALATLRSRNVNVCLMLQSSAQLDRLYGSCARRIIFDNCQFKAILRVDDSETQKMMSDLIGTQISAYKSAGENLDECMGTIGYSRTMSEVREYLIQPHELSRLQDIVLLTPSGCFQVEKIQLHRDGFPWSDPSDNILHLVSTQEEYKALTAVGIPCVKEDVCFYLY